MNYKNLSILELHNKIINKEISILELTNAVISEANKVKSSNAINKMNEEKAITFSKEMEKASNVDSLLYGIPYFAKDNFATKGLETTSSSNILKGYIPPFNATSISKLEDKGAVLIGKAALDELGMGGVGLYSCNGIITNPADSNRIVGGSSSGSAYLVAKGIVPFATGSDTGDSIRKPASFNNIVGFKPSYGAISRYGLLPYSPSLDTVGFFTRNVEDMAVVCDATFGYDVKDATSHENKSIDMLNNISNINKSVKFGYIKKVIDDLNEKVKNSYYQLFETLKSKGYEVVEVQFNQELLDSLSAIYKMISFSESVSTNANLDGIKFGQRAAGSDYVEIITNSRTEGFGNEVKQRFLVGALNLNKENQTIYLNKAKQVRRLIVEELNRVFNKTDILIIPPTDNVAPLIEERKVNVSPEKEYLSDILTLANFNGSPSITIPFVKEGKLGIGININAKPKEDLLCLQAAKLLEDIIGIKNEIVED
ncbi:Aspartyl-tRNA(Asn) amidotransferase subunit A, Glutamyl-tRNA(Gln) amidotransferase subunit A [Mesoplasma florum W37]|uniref:Aspartyl-tRNA(Asn) amidotransferase subunit A / Glutamyl-tRNA(Gln) amidotransferase subunit A n=1 Tax=Mesoplasma florum TaxID=2151 RepID=A0AAD2JDF2_MESFO|nr:amidase family protein [Mesoplasma florum]AGY41234.1 Aspartyl-tRNA(Asn) amidotransferase subunit A, Glutamyl-tRNA(Gln) amidotransferase subunit A [Mesoplasma florum W37]AVN59463.1 Asp-tRNA(Asn)/Glu-tRNA(Gln) amidotransferase GatCAB subunit A [Mesoplasma florum]AVN65572.1 Aspartyl-tRNA(Asn) amidotransferase subunit A / Glutamyl-tRNA(Gln) amidotransferase subunit A [Mesoplasma florum]